MCVWVREGVFVFATLRKKQAVFNLKGKLSRFSKDTIRFIFVFQREPVLWNIKLFNSIILISYYIFIFLFTFAIWKTKLLCQKQWISKERLGHFRKHNIFAAYSKWNSLPRVGEGRLVRHPGMWRRSRPKFPWTERMPRWMWWSAETWGQFHQHAYAQLLCMQIPKVQKAAWHGCLFCDFVICVSKSCS